MRVVGIDCAAVPRRTGLALERGALQATRNEHGLDAVLCCVAALDFLQGKALPPGPLDMVRAGKEGWIWMRDPGL